MERYKSASELAQLASRSLETVEARDLLMLDGIGNGLWEMINDRNSAAQTKKACIISVLAYVYLQGKDSATSYDGLYQAIHDMNDFDGATQLTFDIDIEDIKFGPDGNAIGLNVMSWGDDEEG